MAGNFNDNIMVEFAAGALADTINGDDFTLLRNCTLYDAWSVAKAALGGTVQIFHTSDTAGNDITDAMSVNAADNTLARATVIADNKNEFTTGQVITVKKSVVVATSTFALFNASGASLS
jgi:hypothetical protein